MQLSFLLVPASLFLLQLSSPTGACPAMPDPTGEALVDVGSSSIREPLYFAIYEDEDSPEWSCVAYMTLSLADVPSRRLVPRPRELAESLVPVAKAFGAKTCSIAVWLDDAAIQGDPDACQRGTFRYDGDAWSTVEDDAACW